MIYFILKLIYRNIEVFCTIAVMVAFGVCHILANKYYTDTKEREAMTAKQKMQERATILNTDFMQACGAMDNTYDQCLKLYRSKK